MPLFFSLAVMMCAALAAGLVVQRLRRWQREAAARLGPDEQIRVALRGVPARLFVDTTVTGGPERGAINRTRADLTLGDQTFVLATHHGRVLQIDATHPGSASSTGPRRLVVEGTHPSGITRVRVELLVDEPERWVREIGALAGKA